MIYNHNLKHQKANPIFSYILHTFLFQNKYLHTKTKYG